MARFGFPPLGLPVLAAIFLAALLAATIGLLNMLDRREINGVMAHELAHVRNRDTLTMTVTATIAGAISMLANFGMLFGGRRDNGQGGATVSLTGEKSCRRRRLAYH